MSRAEAWVASLLLCGLVLMVYLAIAWGFWAGYKDARRFRAQAPDPLTVALDEERRSADLDADIQRLLACLHEAERRGEAAVGCLSGPVED